MGKRFVLPVLCVIISFVALHLAFEREEAGLVLVAQVGAGTLIAFILPLTECVLKISLPSCLNYLVSLQILAANTLGSTLGFYEKIPFWDTILHAFSGLVISAVFYSFYILCERPKSRAMTAVIILFIGLGGSAAFELFEYTADTLLGTDAQQVASSVVQGVSPVKDTMTDIAVTTIGVAVYLLYIHIKPKSKSKQ